MFMIENTKVPKTIKKKNNSNINSKMKVQCVNP